MLAMNRQNGQILVTVVTLSLEMVLVVVKVMRDGRIMEGELLVGLQMCIENLRIVILLFTI